MSDIIMMDLSVYRGEGQPGWKGWGQGKGQGRGQQRLRVGIKAGGKISSGDPPRLR